MRRDRRRASLDQSTFVPEALTTNRPKVHPPYERHTLRSQPWDGSRVYVCPNFPPTSDYKKYVENIRSSKFLIMT